MNCLKAEEEFTIGKNNIWIESKTTEDIIYYSDNLKSLFFLNQNNSNK